MSANQSRNAGPSNRRYALSRRALLWSAAAPLLGCAPAHAQSDAETLVLSSGVDVTGMNALDVITVVPDRSLVDHIADTLTRTDQPGHIGPMLATNWSVLDERTWEVKLRQGVTFHNGEPFNANAVKFTYDTLIDPKVSVPAKSNFTFVSGVDVVDDYTVHIHTKEPSPLTPNLMALLSAIPPHYVNEVGLDGYRRKPIGTGPYKFVEHVRDADLRLAAFENYWGGPQRYKTIIYRPIPEDAARISALLAGEIDLCIDVPPELIPMIGKSKSSKVKMVPSARVSMLVFSGMKPEYPTAKREVREAISIAVDRESLNANILGGTGTPAAWINPDTFGINPALKPLAYDPQRAKQLLTAAGYPDGFDIVMDTSDGKYLKDRELAEAVAGQLAKVGIRVKLQPMEWGVFTRRMFSHQASPIAMMDWEDPRNDPDAHNRLMLTSGSTWSQIDDPALTDLVKRIEREMDPVKRKALIFEEQDMLRTSFPTAYLVLLGGIYGVSSKLDWWQPRPDFKDWFYQNNAV